MSEEDGPFAVTAEYADGARFLELYAGAYRPNAVRVARLLRQPSLAPSVVDPGAAMPAPSRMRGLEPSGSSRTSSGSWSSTTCSTSGAALRPSS